MNIRTQLLQFFGICTAATLGTWIASSTQAQVQHDGLSELGLTVHWETNIGGAPLANGKHSFVVWPHTTAKREHVTVKVGTRSIARIHGDEIDNAALEKAIIEGVRPAHSPRLGLKGATEKAQKLVATYKTLGRKAEIESFSQNVTYVVSLASNGILEAIDGESGGVVWQVEVGDSSLPMFGPGVSDEYVVVTNGNQLYTYDLTTGNLVNTRRLQFSPTGSPATFLGKAMVPSIDGRNVAYDINNFKIAPIVLRSSVENRLGTTMSADRQYISWPVASKLIIAKLDKTPSLWSSLTFGESMSSLPVAVENGFVGSTINGTVFLCAAARADAVIWKHRLAVQVTKSPIVGNGIAVIVSDDGFAFALNLADGTSVWQAPIQNVIDVLAVGKKHVYAKNTSGVLIAYDVATGVEVARTGNVIPDVLPNSINDRLFLVSRTGQLSCLREVDAIEPVLVNAIGVKDAAPAKETQKTQEEDSKPVETDDSIFEGAGDAPMDADDPFGTP